MKKIFIASIFMLMVLLQIHNVMVYPEFRSFDARAHIEFINYIKNNIALPLPDYGWEMFQAPLYYVLVSALPSLKYVQYFGLLLWFSLFLLVYILTIKKTNFSKTRSFFISTFLLSMPITIYLTPSIGNEFFSTIMISIFLVTYKVCFDKDTRSIYENLLLGFLLGLSLLSKATGIILLISFIIVEAFKFAKSKTIFKNLWFSVTTSLIISGWFYFRNFLLYKNILYQPADYLPLSSYAQPIIERNLNFFLSPKSLINFDLMSSHYYSFLGGTYYSWFYDGHTILLPVQEISKAGNILIIFSYIFVAIGIKGFLFFIKRKNIFDIFIIYPALLFLSYILYNFKLPFYSTVKAVFVSSLFIPYSYFYLKGYERLGSSAQYFIKILMVLYILLVFKIFWVQPSWYRI